MGQLSGTLDILYVEDDGEEFPCFLMLCEKMAFCLISNV